MLPIDGDGALTDFGAWDAPAPAAAGSVATAIPEAERRHVVAMALESGGRVYYGLDNGFIVGRDLRTGARIWAHRTAGTPAGALAAVGGTLIAQDDRGNLYRLGLHEGAEPTDVTAYLRLADLARRREQTADAEAIYRHIVEEVKPNVPEAWQRYEESQF